MRDAVPVTEPSPAPSAARAVGVDVTDPDLDADVRAVLAALALPARRDGTAPADVVVTDRADAGPGPGAARVIRVAADAAGVGPDDGEVVPLPSGTARLVALLAAPVAAPAGRLVAVAGAVGGCGTSVLATALAVRAAARTRALLVECDPRGTGLDLLLGLETAAGARVGDVRSALGGPDPEAVWAAVPAVVPGCGVLARGRVAGDRGDVGVDGGTGAADAAVAHRSAGGLAVCDSGALRHDDPVPARADLVVVVTRADLAGAVAAGRAIASVSPAERAALVVRSRPGDPLHPADVADAAGASRWHALPELAAVRRLSGAGDLGRALGRGRGGGVRRLAGLADRLLEEVGVDAR